MQRKRIISRMERKYKLTSMSAMKWAKHELEHIGRIVSVEDPDIQYSYAMSTLYGMLHLIKALTELVNDSAYSVQREDLQRTLDQVVRAIKHLIKDFSLDVNAIRAFNTKKILGDLTNISPANQPRANTGGVPAAPRSLSNRGALGPPSNRGALGSPNNRAAPGSLGNRASTRNTRKNNNKQSTPKYFFGLF